MRWSVVVVVALACSKQKADEVPADQRARAASLIGELKKSLLGAVTEAMGRGIPAAIATCHVEAPALTARVSREGAIVGRATRKPRNPTNQATGWQADALAYFEKLHANRTPLAGQSYARVLDGGTIERTRGGGGDPSGFAGGEGAAAPVVIAYAEPLVIQDICLACHGQTLAPDVSAALADKYPDDRATGYAVGDLRGVAWVELPAK